MSVLLFRSVGACALLLCQIAPMPRRPAASLALPALYRLIPQPSVTIEPQATADRAVELPSGVQL